MEPAQHQAVTGPVTWVDNGRRITRMYWACFLNSWSKMLNTSNCTSLLIAGCSEQRRPNLLKSMNVSKYFVPSIWFLIAWESRMGDHLVRCRCGMTVSQMFPLQLKPTQYIIIISHYFSRAQFCWEVVKMSRVKFWNTHNKITIARLFSVMKQWKRLPVQTKETSKLKTSVSVSISSPETAGWRRLRSTAKFLKYYRCFSLSLGCQVVQESNIWQNHPPQKRVPHFTAPRTRISLLAAQNPASLEHAVPPGEEIFPLKTNGLINLPVYQRFIWNFFTLLLILFNFVTEEMLNSDWLRAVLPEIFQLND